MEIPLSVANVGTAEKEAVNRVLDSGKLKGGGPYWEQASNRIESMFDVPRAMLTTSCTHALEMAAILLEIGDDDEVVVPSYTFPSTANAFARQGAQIRFCDVKPETMNIDPGHLQEVVTSDTRAIVPVHYAGVGCEMDTIQSIAEDNGCVVVEDAAQGVHASFEGRALGTIGALGCYSFHETKNYSAGEGGALLLNDSRFEERAEYAIHKGTNYAKFSRGEVGRYTWVDIGSSYVPTEMQSALVETQLGRADELRNERQSVYEYYQSELDPLAKDGRIVRPVVPDGRQSNYHIYHIRTETSTVRDELMSYLRNQGIGAASHYEPLHSSRMGRRYGYKSSDLPVTSSNAARLLRLPIHAKMNDDDCEYVVETVESFFDEYGG